MLRDGKRSVLRAGEKAHIEPGVWHDGGTRATWTHRARRSRGVSDSPT